MRKVNSWMKFRLLLWKNWVIQFSQKNQIVVQILMPVIFVSLVVLLRLLIQPKFVPKRVYDDYVLQPTLMLPKLYLKRIQAIYNKTESEDQLIGQERLYPKFELLYSPTNPHLEKIIALAATMLKINHLGLEDADTLEKEFVKRNSFVGIQFDDSLRTLNDYPNHFKYAIRFPKIMRTQIEVMGDWETDKIYPEDVSLDPRNEPSSDGGHPACYTCEGFIDVQHAVAISFIQLKSEQNNIPKISISRFAHIDYTTDPLLHILNSFLGLLIILSFIYPCTSLAKYITSEKEKQLKEVMKIMGLDGWIHWVAWFVKSILIFSLLSILMVIYFKIEWKDAAIFPNSSYTVLFVYFIVYCTAATTFCFMLAVSFSKASSSAAATGVIWFLSYIPFYIILLNYDDTSLGEKYAWCFLCNTALQFGLKIIIDLELKGEGLQWHNMFDIVTPIENLTVGEVMLIMMLAAILYLLICLYIEQVFPGNFGVPKKWDFLCFDDDDDDLDSLSSNDDNTYENRDAFEVETRDRKMGVVLKGLRKRYGDKEVVKGVSLNIYENDVTVLLGHNGAGKTTTICMLIGMIAPTFGTALINGYDIRSDGVNARQSLGLCPQHNVLFDTMTVADHIVFYSRLKGLKKKEIKSEIDKYLKKIGLEDLAHTPTCKLSSGMKRKLSFCCALCGDTKVVVCDEPTSGMDPAARRQLWEIIQSEKSGRTILLTTHYMDEADVLGDRIAIMSDGELKCSGTSFFLKKKFGYGYRLICLKRPDCNVPAVTDLLRRYIPNIQPLNNTDSELSYQLPETAIPKFQQLLSNLETNLEKLNIERYSIEQSSLEDVFMNVGAEMHESGNYKVIGHEENKYLQYTQKVLNENRQQLTRCKLYMNQWKAMFVKNYSYLNRRRLLYLTQILIPLFLVIVTYLVDRNIQKNRNVVPLSLMLPTQAESARAVLEIPNPTAASILTNKIGQNYEKLIDSYGNNYNLERTTDRTVTEHILDLQNKDLSLYNWYYLVGATVTDQTITVWYNNQGFHMAPLALNLVHNAIARALIDESVNITVINSPIAAFEEQMKWKTAGEVGNTLGNNICFAMCFVTAFYILFLINERVTRSKLLQFIGGARISVFWIVHIIWNYFTFTIIVITILITIKICAIENYDSFQELSRIMVIMLVFGFGALPMTYFMSYLFTEPAQGYAVLTVLNIMLGQACYIVYEILSIKQLELEDTAKDWREICSLYPHFAMTIAFKNVAINVATTIKCESNSVQMMNDEERCEALPQCCKTIQFYGWEDPGVMTELDYMATTGIFFIFIIFIKEYGWLKCTWCKALCVCCKSKNENNDSVDDDVENEKNRIANLTKSELEEHNLVLNRVSKFYKRKPVVNDVSFSTKDGECFGLAGLNSAGKTETFKMIIGETNISRGKIYVRGKNASKNLRTVYKDMGYCPQTNALLEDLSGRETLKIFFLLRGFKQNDIQSMSEGLAKGLGFMRHMDKPIKAYSGGNKRKLMTAIAMIGSPSIILLDDPTVGMDPASRRHLLRIICWLRDSGKSIVLTSYGMDELEETCTTIAIMVQGRLMCFGSSQHLKHKFSKGFILRIMLSPLREDNSFQAVTDVKNFIIKNFPNATLKEEYDRTLTFHVADKNFKFSIIFGLLETHKSELQIEDYSINQTTLEDVFLDFAS